MAKKNHHHQRRASGLGKQSCISIAAITMTERMIWKEEHDQKVSGRGCNAKDGTNKDSIFLNKNLSRLRSVGERWLCWCFLKGKPALGLLQVCVNRLACMSEL